MQRRNQAQRRRDQAQKQRDQAKKKNSRLEQQEDQAQTAESQQSRVEQQEDQAQGAGNPQGQAQPQEVLRFELSEKIDKMPSTLQELKEIDLISAQEAREMEKMHAYSRKTVQPQCLASVLERLQAYLSDAGKSSRQRRLVRRAREVIQYHADMQSRYQAQQEADRVQAVTRQSQPAQVAQQQSQQARASQQQPQQVPVAQQQSRQSTTAPQQNYPLRAARATQLPPMESISEPSRSIIANIYRQSELSEQQFQEFRLSCSTEALYQWNTCVETARRLLPLVYQGSYQAVQELENMAPTLLQPLRYMERQRRGHRAAQRLSAQPNSTQAAPQQSHITQPAGALTDPEQSQRNSQQRSSPAHSQGAKAELSDDQRAYLAACSDHLKRLMTQLRSLNVVSQREVSQIQPPPPDVVAWLKLLEDLERKLQAHERGDLEKATDPRIAQALGTFQTLRSWIFEFPQVQPQPRKGHVPPRPRPSRSAASSRQDLPAMDQSRRQITTQSRMPGPEDAVRLRMVLEGLQGLDLVSDVEEMLTPRDLSVWRDTITVLRDKIEVYQREGRIRTVEQHQKVLKLRELLSVLEKRLPA